MMLIGNRNSLREGQALIAAPTDKALIERGDIGAFEQLYERYVDGIYRYCRLRLPTVVDAEDVTATVFERAFAAFPPKTTGAFRGWLFTIAHNEIVNHWRAGAKRRQDRALDDELPLIDPGPTPEEELLDAEEHRKLKNALARLPEDQRRVIELRLAGLTGMEIAAVLDRSPTAARQLQYRAMQHLRRIYSEESHHANQ
jgi:RNA polymerase sigma-70 factor (ECF subfamily)